MGSVEVFTKDRMLEIENSSVTGGQVESNGNLTLIQRDGTEIDAGSLAGTLPGRLSPAGLEVTDWDNALETGFYWGANAANSPSPIDNAISPNYYTGIVKIFNASGNFRIIQELREVRTNAVDVIYTRYYNNISWSSWTADLSNLSGSLGASDLNDVVVPGVYFQGTIVNGTPANHYPLPMATSGVLSTTAGTAGMLEVFKWRESDQIFQRFTRRPDATQPQVWTRGKYLSGGSWSAWQDISQPVSDWVDLSSYLASGISHISDSGVPNPQARRIGNMVELMFSSLYIDSLSIPTNGDVGNRLILNAVPVQFRPNFPTAISPGAAGLPWSGYMGSNGGAALATMPPPSTATATATYTNLRISGYALYPVDP